MGIVENEILACFRKFDACSFDVELDKKVSKIGNGTSDVKLVFENTPDMYSLLDSTTLALGEAYVSGNLSVEALDDNENPLYDAIEIFLAQYDKIALKKRKYFRKIPMSKHFKALKQEIKNYYRFENDIRMQSLLQKLELKKGMIVCDIGCGHAELMIEAAKKYSIRGVMISYNKKEKEKLSNIIENENLDGLIEVKYVRSAKIPKLLEKFDRIICVNTFNHLKYNKYKKVFSKAKDLLKENGKMYLEVMHNSRGYKKDPWVNKYICANTGYPNLKYVLQSAANAGFSIKSAKSIRKDYSLKYLELYKCIIRDKEELEEKFNTKDIRIWELYLCACAVAFNVCFLDVNEMIFE